VAGKNKNKKNKKIKRRPTALMVMFVVLIGVHFPLTHVTENCSSIFTSRTFPPESSSKFSPQSTLGPFWTHAWIMIRFF